MRQNSRSQFRTLRSVAPVLLAVMLGSSVHAQTSPYIPVISGGIGIFSSTNEGFTFVQPVVAPVLAFPLGQHILIESRADLRGLVQQSGPHSSFEGSFTASLEYLQADYIANRHMTLVAGRFQTPFGVYNERLTPLWIRNLQDVPLIFGIGTRTSGSSLGAMLRGNLYDNRKVELNYIAYFSAERKAGQFQAARTAGDRIDVYLPNQGLEIGTSYQRFLQDTHANAVGAHVWWIPSKSAVQIRSEYAHGAHAQGYWVETAYRLSRFGGQDSLIGRFQPVFRMQESFRNSPGNGDGLPTADTKQADFGFDYYLPHDVRLNTSYARTFSTVNGNIWDISLTHRFVFPLWRGGK